MFYMYRVISMTLHDHSSNLLAEEAAPTPTGPGRGSKGNTNNNNNSKSCDKNQTR